MTGRQTVHYSKDDYIAQRAAAQHEIQGSVINSLQRGDWIDAMKHVAMLVDTVTNRAAVKYRGDKTPTQVLTRPDQFSDFPKDFNSTGRKDNKTIAQKSAQLNREVADLLDAYLKHRIEGGPPIHAGLSHYYNPNSASPAWGPKLKSVVEYGYGKDHSHRGGHLPEGKSQPWFQPYDVAGGRSISDSSPRANAILSGTIAMPTVGELEQGAYVPRHYTSVARPLGLSAIDRYDWTKGREYPTLETKGGSAHFGVTPDRYTGGPEASLTRRRVFGVDRDTRLPILDPEWSDTQAGTFLPTVPMSERNAGQRAVGSSAPEITNHDKVHDTARTAVDFVFDPELLGAGRKFDRQSAEPSDMDRVRPGLGRSSRASLGLNAGVPPAGTSWSIVDLVFQPESMGMPSMFEPGEDADVAYARSRRFKPMRWSR